MNDWGQACPVMFFDYQEVENVIPAIVGECKDYLGRLKVGTCYSCMVEKRILPTSIFEN